jgi:tRNA(fMet)-specific endonuclease VapC
MGTAIAWTGTKGRFIKRRGLGMNICLDTDICIGVLRGKEPDLHAKLKSFPIAAVALPSIVVAELWVGVEKSTHPTVAKKKLEIFLRDLPTLPFGDKEAQIYGVIRADLEKKGISIGANDLLIAATVLEAKGKLITRNHREYSRIKSLDIEVW